MPIAKRDITKWLFAATAFAALGLAAGCQMRPGNADSALLRGWEPKNFKYEIQFPYNLKLADRYSLDPATGIMDFIVFGSDKPHAPPPNTTNARTELRISDVYRTVPHMFEADFCIKPGTHACIMQVFGAAKRATTFMLDAQPDGTLSYYDTPDDNYKIIRKNMNNLWFNLKIIHIPVTPDGLGLVTVYIDNQLAFQTPGHGGTQHYFKCGLYSRTDPDPNRKSEVLIRNIRYFAPIGAPAETQPATMK